MLASEAIVMGKHDNGLSELGRAAATLESELGGLEALSRSVRKIRLNSEKNLARAAKELNEVLALPARLAEGLQALAAAMAGMQARQQAALEPLAAFADDIQRRMQRLAEHMQAFAALGTLAGEVTALIQASDGEAERTALLARVDGKLEELARGARSLFEAAHGDDFPEVAREADALKQRAAALRRKLDGAH